MSRRPRNGSAEMKCLSCDAPTVETVDGDHVCVECGASPRKHRRAGRDGAVKDAVRLSKLVSVAGNRTLRLEFTLESSCDVPVFVHASLSIPAPLAGEDFTVYDDTDADRVVVTWTGIEVYGVVEPSSPATFGFLVEDPSVRDVRSVLQPTLPTVSPIVPGEEATGPSTH